MQRREFLGLGALGLTGLLLPPLTPWGRSIAAEALLEPVDTARRRLLADAALSAARGAGASYCDVRVGRYLRQSVITREARVENLPLCTYPLAWVASPRLDLGPEPLTMERIGQLPVITYPSSSSPYRAVQDMLTRAGVAAPRMYGSASLSMVVRMTMDCIGTSVIAPVFLDKELARGELRLLHVQAEPLPDLAFTATWVEGPDSHAARAIARLAQRIAAEHERARSPQPEI